MPRRDARWASGANDLFFKRKQYYHWSGSGSATTHRTRRCDPCMPLDLPDAARQSGLARALRERL